MARRPLAALLITALLLPPWSLAAEKVKPKEELQGYAEWRQGDILIVDGQRVRLAAGGRFEGEGEARQFSSIPMGYEVEATGRRQADGVFLAKEVESQPNGIAVFEKQVRALTDDAEAKYRRAGRYYVTQKKRTKVVGRLFETGREVDRVRRIVDTLLPPYVEPEDVRVYVIENKEWNAFAMGNYSIFVFSGLLDDMDDHELAIVLGHEIAHATHEHTRRRFRKAMAVQLVAAGLMAASHDIDDRKKRALAGLLTVFVASALTNGYGRDLEDQADRVGLRYAYEAGYDVGRGPALWQRFARKYGQKSQAVNFFFGDHSLASARAKNLEEQISLNYREGPKAVGVRAPRPRTASRPTVPAEEESPRASAYRTPAQEARRPPQRAEIKEGMTQAEVQRILGQPEREYVYSTRTKWRYQDLTVIFRQGRVTEVRF